MTKIGIVIDRIIVGGVEKIAIQEVRALRKAGAEAYLIVLRRKSIAINAYDDLLEDIPVVYLDDRLPSFLRFSFPMPFFHFFALFHLTYPIMLPFIVKKNEFDYLFVHGTYTSLAVRNISRKQRIPASALIWDPIVYIIDRVYADRIPKIILPIMRQLCIKIDKYILKSFQSIVLGSDAHLELVKSLHPNGKYSVLYPAVNPTASFETKENYIMAATAWKAGKNPEYFVEIIKELPEVTIKLVGRWIDEDYKARFIKFLKENDATDHIEIIGGVSEERLSELYGKALVLLQTNFDPGFGMPALEAAAQGTTFIIPRDQGVCKLFIDGEDGFYTKEHDTQDIVSKLKYLTANKDVAVAMGQTGWKRVKDKYSWDAHAGEIIALYKDQDHQVRADKELL